MDNYLNLHEIKTKYRIFNDPAEFLNKGLTKNGELGSIFFFVKLYKDGTYKHASDQILQIAINENKKFKFDNYKDISIENSKPITVRDKTQDQIEVMGSIEDFYCLESDIKQYLILNKTINSGNMQNLKFIPNLAEYSIKLDPSNRIIEWHSTTTRTSKLTYPIIVLMLYEFSMTKRTEFDLQDLKAYSLKVFPESNINNFKLKERFPLGKKQDGNYKFPLLHSQKIDAAISFDDSKLVEIPPLLQVDYKNKKVFLNLNH